jgi:hypothetical protein
MVPVVANEVSKITTRNQGRCVRRRRSIESEHIKSEYGSMSHVMQLRQFDALAKSPSSSSLTRSKPLQPVLMKDQQYYRLGPDLPSAETFALTITLQSAAHLIQVRTASVSIDNASFSSSCCRPMLSRTYTMVISFSTRYSAMISHRKRSKICCTLNSSRNDRLFAFDHRSNRFVRISNRFIRSK